MTFSKWEKENVLCAITYVLELWKSRWWISTCLLCTGTETGSETGAETGAGREHNKVNKEVFDWLLKNIKNAASAIISRFDWLSLDFPGNKWTGKLFISDCTCPRDNFPVPFAKWKSTLTSKLNILPWGWNTIKLSQLSVM